MSIGFARDTDLAAKLTLGHLVQVVVLVADGGAATLFILAVAADNFTLQELTPQAELTNYGLPS